MSRTHLQIANQLFKAGDYGVAHEHYLKALASYGEDAPRSLVSGILLSIKMCEAKAPDLCFPAVKEEVSTRNPVVLAINPSHGHPTEVEFWTNFVSFLAKNDAEFVDVAFRKFDPFPGAMSVTLPARMEHLRKVLDPFAQAELPDWADDDLVDIYTDWEHRRWSVPKYHPHIKIGVTNTIHYIDQLVREMRPAAIVTTNKIDPPNRFGFLAAKHYGIPYYFVERSPFNGALVEKAGMFSESELIERVTRSLLTADRKKLKSSESLKNLLVDNPYGFRADEAVTVAASTRSGSGKPLFFLPLDNILWTGWAPEGHPQGRIDYPLFETPEDALAEILAAVDDLGGKLVVKPHPSCKEWPRLAKQFPKIDFVDADLAQLTRDADVVITFLTKVAYLGLGHSKPVVSFGAGLLDGFGVTYQVRSVYEVKEKLSAALKKEGLEQKCNKFDELLPHLENSYLYRGDHAADSIWQDVRASVNALGSDDRKALVEAALKSKSGRSQAKKVTYSVKANEIPVVFDASRLINARLKFSGISRYVGALVQRLREDPRVNPIFAYQSKQNDYGLSGQVFNNIEKQFGIQLVHMPDALRLVRSANQPYVFHSPVEPLLHDTKNPLERRVITIHDVLHLTHRDFYSGPQVYTNAVLDSIDETTSIIFDSAYSMHDYATIARFTPPQQGVVHLAADSVFKFDRDVTQFLASHDLSSSDEIICFPCQSDPRKNFTRMMSVSAKWATKSLNRKIVVFGGGNGKDDFHQNLLDVPEVIRKQFLYIQNPSDKDVRLLYNVSLAQLYLSEAEGFGLPPLEAMQSGCPAIVLNNTSLTEVYEGWRFQLPNDSSDEIVLNALDQVASEGLGGTARNEASDFARKYHWRRCVDETVSFYEQVLKNV